MIVNGMRADELVGDKNLEGNPNATGGWKLKTEAEVMEAEMRQMLVAVANKGETEAVRLHARLLLLRVAYLEAKAAGRPLGQLVANGKLVAKRLGALGVVA